VNIVKQVARGLGAAHALGIVHRDLKPANIFLCQREGRRRIVRRTSRRTADETGPQFVIEPEDKYDFVKLLDFGVAKFMDLGPSAATRAGMFCGTPHYLSPEQAQEQSASERSDIYSLGVVFYEMVTGSVPYDGTSMFEILKGHVVGELVPPSRRAPDAGIGPHVEAVIGRCLEKEPARRYASTDELCDALSDCVGECAFLRDAHRLPGIADSGLDLTDNTPSARKGGERSAPVERGFTAVEKEGAWAELADIDERPGGRGDERPGRRKRPVDRRDTMRIPRRRFGRTALAAVGLLVAAGGALWAFRGPLGLSKPATVSVAVSPRSPTSPMPPPSTPARPAEPAVAAAQVPAPAPSPPPARVAPAASTGAQTAGQAEVPGLAPAASDKAADLGAEKSAPRPRAVVAGGSRRSPSSPTALPPVVAAAPTPELPPPPPPSPEPVPAAPAVDVEALLREAQQAWSRRYYAVAIDKARLVLAAAPGRHDAYQIIAVCSCAVGSADDAREAMSHLDPHKQKLVQSLCKNHGLTLE
jgi:serine/threonine-protein kinase